MTDPQIRAAQELAAAAVEQGRKILAAVEARGVGDPAEVQALRDAITDVERHAANPPCPACGHPTVEHDSAGCIPCDVQMIERNDTSLRCPRALGVAAADLVEEQG